MDTFTREKVEHRILEKLSGHMDLSEDQKKYVVTHPQLLYRSTGNAISDIDPEFLKYDCQK
jgi:hypothetical protein